MQAIGEFMMAGALFSAVMQGMGEQKKEEDIRNQITQLTNKTKTLTKLFSSLIKKDITIIAKEKEEYWNASLGITALHTEMDSLKLDYHAKQFKIAISGIIFITFVFFTLLLKYFLPADWFSSIFNFKKPKPTPT